MIKNLTCICCPIGCTLTAELEADKISSISGNKCKRGIQYAQEELFNPVRILTTTIFIPEKNTMLPVRSDKPLPKDKMCGCVSFIKTIKVDLPIKMGQILVNNIEGTAIIASCDMK